MWCINDVSGAVSVEATILLDVLQFGQGLPRGFDGQKEKGFSFYELELKEYQRQCLRGRGIYSK